MGHPLYLGTGYKCLYMMQGVLGIQTFIRHWRTNTPAAKLLCIAVSWCQYSIGTRDSNAKKFGGRGISLPVTYEGLNTKDTLHHIQAFVACSKVKEMAHPDTNCSVLIVAHLAKEILVKPGLQGL